MHDSLVRCSIPLSARINIHHCWCSKLSCLVVFLKTILIRYFSFYSLLFSSPKKNEKRPVFLLLIDERILSIRGSFVKKKYQLGGSQLIFAIFLAFSHKAKKKKTTPFDRIKQILLFFHVSMFKSQQHKYQFVLK